MRFYAVLNAVNSLLSGRHLHLRRCHRYGCKSLHYYITDDNNNVITPAAIRPRIGMTLEELMRWLEVSDLKLHANEINLLKVQLQ